jgi:hypothetical protein
MRGYCNECKENVILIPKKIDHFKYAFLSFCTVGIWSLPWMIRCYQKKYICKQCECTDVVPENAEEKREKRAQILGRIFMGIIVFIFIGICLNMSNCQDEKIKERVEKEKHEKLMEEYSAIEGYFKLKQYVENEWAKI